MPLPISQAEFQFDSFPRATADDPPRRLFGFPDLKRGARRRRGPIASDTLARASLPVWLPA